MSSLLSSCSSDATLSTFHFLQSGMIMTVLFTLPVRDILNAMFASTVKHFFKYVSFWPARMDHTQVFSSLMLRSTMLVLVLVSVLALVMVSVVVLMQVAVYLLMQQQQ